MKKKPQYLENGKALRGHDPLSVYNGKAIMGDENNYEFVPFESNLGRKIDGMPEPEEDFCLMAFEMCKYDNIILQD